MRGLSPERVSSLEAVHAEGRFADLALQLRDLLGTRPSRNSRMPRALRVRLATLCRYAGLIDHAMAILYPIVRPAAKTARTPGTKSRATEKELIEYAECLIALQFDEKADELLEKLDPQHHPEVLRIRGGLRTARGQAEAAIPLLRAYSDATAKADPAFYLDARLHLAWALAACGDPAVEDVLAEIDFLAREKWNSTSEFASTDARRRALSTHFPSIRATLAFKKKEFAEAERHYTDAEKLLEEFHLPGVHWSRDRKIICRLYQLPVEQRSLAALDTARQEALSQRAWDHLRSLDTHEAILSRNHEKAAFVYFGSPSQDVRSEIREALGNTFALPTCFEYRIGTGRLPANPLRINLEHAQLLGRRRRALKEGGALHRLLLALFRDFYRPPTRARLFARVYPDRILQRPHFSSQQIHQLLERLKRALRECGIPLKINEKQGNILLSSPSCIVISIPRSSLENAPPTSVRDHGLHRLRQKAPRLGEAFSSREVARILGVSEAV